MPEREGFKRRFCESGFVAAEPQSVFWQLWG